MKADRLAQVVEEVDRDRGTAGNRVYYLATVPTVFAEIAAALGQAGLNAPSKPE